MFKYLLFLLVNYTKNKYKYNINGFRFYTNCCSIFTGYNVYSLYDKRKGTNK